MIFIVWIAFIPLEQQQQQQKLESHKREYENKNFGIIIMPSEDTKLL